MGIALICELLYNINKFLTSLFMSTGNYDYYHSSSDNQTPFGGTDKRVETYGVQTISGITVCGRSFGSKDYVQTERPNLTFCANNGVINFVKGRNVYICRNTPSNQRKLSAEGFTYATWNVIGSNGENSGINQFLSDVKFWERDEVIDEPRSEFSQRVQTIVLDSERRN